MSEKESIFFIFVLVTLSLLSIVIINLVLRHRRALLLHQERLAAMDKGMAIPPEPAPTRAAWTPRIYLLRGLVWLFSGFGAAVFLAGISLSTLRPAPIEHRLNQAQYMRQRGTPESEVQLYLRTHANDQMGLPYGWALIGLIPMGVGLAYIVFYRAEGHNLGNGR